MAVNALAEPTVISNDRQGESGQLAAGYVMPLVPDTVFRIVVPSSNVNAYPEIPQSDGLVVAAGKVYV